MSVPDSLKYTDTHEWVKPEADGTVTVGITDHAQQQLGDVVFLELPESGRMVAKGEECGVIESVKAASDVYSPIAGTVVESNADLGASPELVNQDCYGRGWLMRLQPAASTALDALLGPAAYSAQLAAEGG